MRTIKQYVPILRWRPAEMLAVERLYHQDREAITPFIEFIMPPPKTDRNDRNKILEDSRSKFMRQLSDIGKRLLKHCGKNSVFLDVHLLDGDIRASAFENILSSANTEDLFSIPVVHIIPVVGTDADMATRKVAVKYAKIDGRGLCIRIDNSHLKEGIAKNVEDFMQGNNLNIKNVDILIDMQIVDSSTTTESVIEKLSLVPQIDSCRSFILSGGAFPKDLSEFQKFENHQLDRTDWKLWREIVSSGKLIRKPFFSDYTIQHPIFYGYIQGGNVSASVRYTHDEQWKIFRGEALNYIDKKGKKGPGYQQYLAHARELIKQPFYKKANYSFGDSEINRIAAPNNQKTGNPQIWLSIGINHHLTLVARQVSSFFEKSAMHS